MSKGLSIFSALFLGIAYILSHQIIGLVFLFNTVFDTDSINSILWLDSILTITHRVLFLIFILLILYKIKVLKLIINSVKKKVDWKYIFGSALLGILFVFAQYPLNYIYGVINDEKFILTFSSSQIDPWDIPNIISSISIVVITQEFFFRGFILNSLKQNYGELIAVIISSFLFAITHLSSLNIIYLTFFGGLIAGGIYIKTNKILLPITFHTFWNITAYFIKYV